MNTPRFSSFYSSRRDYSLWLIPIIIIGAAALPFAYSQLYRPEQVQYVITKSGIAIPGLWEGRSIPASALQPESARIVDLNVETALAPAMRLQGVRTPGYEAGSYKLKNGKKAYVFIRDRSRVAVIPTTLGYDLLLSIHEDPEEFLQRIRVLWKQ